jgi:hypothetical protein
MWWTIILFFAVVVIVIGGLSVAADRLGGSETVIGLIVIILGTGAVIMFTGMAKTIGTMLVGR